MVDEQNTVQMVDLVLQASCEEPFRGNLVLFAIDIGIRNANLGRSLDLCVVVRNGETAFLIDISFLARRQYLRIDEYLRGCVAGIIVQERPGEAGRETPAGEASGTGPITGEGGLAA